MANAADRTALNEQDKKEKRYRNLYLAALKDVLQTPSGRLVCWDLIRYCDRISFSQSGSQMCFNEGERNISLQMKADAIDVSSESFLLMQAEAIKRNNEVKDDDGK